MNIEKMKNFDECIEESGPKRHLVLGNGFSVALFPQIFNYKRLSEKIQDNRIKKIFKELDTTDFEFVLLKLVESLKVLNYYDEKKEIYEVVKNDTERLKKILIQVITDSHPSDPSKITFDQYYSCRLFLKHFEGGRKYTFNYDLLLYWTYMQFLNNAGNPLSMDDGFRTNENDSSTITWEIGREFKQDLYYVHGAMHIFKNEDAIIEKYTWKNNGKTIGQQVRESIESGKFPVFISEGTTEHKLKRIKENGYLSRAFSSVKNIRGDIFIFGHSLRDEDDHFFDILNENKSIKRVYISIFGDPRTKDNQKIINKINQWRDEFANRTYILYQAESAKVWDENWIVDMLLSDES